MAPSLDIFHLRDRPELFEAVVELGNRYRATLGLFPREAMRQRAETGQLLIALDRDGLAGYILFRLSRGRHPRRATIDHLCVDADRRGQGVARALVEALKAEARDLDGIRLTCRKDYEANGLWPKLGFTLLGERPGRSKKGTVKDVWWLSNGAPLLSRMWERVSEDTVVAALDANVVFDLESDQSDSLESKALMSDWVSEQVLFIVTPELNNEIGRRKDASDRSRSRALAGRFPTRGGDANVFESACTKLELVLGVPNNESQASDIRELAWAIAGEVDYFVTRDERLLGIAEELEDQLSLTVLRPTTLVAKFDELINGSAYHPRRFEGSRLTLRPASQRSEAELVDAYLDFAANEKKTPFINTLRGALANNPREVIEVVGPNHEPLVLYQTITRPGVVELPILRVSRSRLAPTLLRHLLTTLTTSSRGAILKITEVHMSPKVELALAHTGFIRPESSWMKPCLDYIGPSTHLAQPLARAGVADQHIQVSSPASEPQLLALERTLFPAKITDLELPCYVIPIRASWAAQLFETRLAEQDLFGLPPELGFRLENVYYSATRRGFQAPARLVWYVSKTNATHEGAGKVRAVSYLDEVIKDQPKALFSRFRRLGVYRWQNLMDMTKGSTSATLTALKFSGTELLSVPLPWSDLQTRLVHHIGKANQLQGPVEITSELFFEIYSTATAAS